MRAANVDEDMFYVSEYAEDIHNYWRKKEQQLPPYLQRSPQLIYRRALVLYIAWICEKLHFCLRIKHLAVYYLDVFMDHHNIEVDHLQLIAVGCLIVAAKTDERDVLIPKMSEFNQILHNAYKLRELVEMEMSLMSFLDWHLLAPTAVTFRDYYVRYTLNEDEDCLAEVAVQGIKRLRRTLKRYVDYFIDLSIQALCCCCFFSGSGGAYPLDPLLINASAINNNLVLQVAVSIMGMFLGRGVLNTSRNNDYAFRAFLPSVVAASSIAAARLCVMIDPAWPNYLEEITQYDLDRIGSCTARMIVLFQNEQREQLQQQQQQQQQQEEQEQQQNDEDNLVADKNDGQREDEGGDKMGEERNDQMNDKEGDQIIDDYGEIDDENHKLEGNECDQVEGEEADQIEGEEADQIEGEEADQIEGEEADQIEGEEADQIEGEEADQIEGEEADQIEGEEADQMEGERADQMKGENAYQMEGEKADQIETEEDDQIEYENCNDMVENENGELVDDKNDQIIDEECDRSDNERSNGIEYNYETEIDENDDESSDDSTGDSDGETSATDDSDSDEDFLICKRFQGELISKNKYYHRIDDPEPDLKDADEGEHVDCNDGQMDDVQDDCIKSCKRDKRSEIEADLIAECSGSPCKIRRYDELNDCEKDVLYDCYRDLFENSSVYPILTNDDGEKATIEVESEENSDKMAYATTEVQKPDGVFVL